MTLRPFLLSLAALLALAASPVQAQDDTLSPVIEGLEVVAKPPGPALWRVSRGGSEVVILGTVAPLAHLLTWDDRRLRRAMTGAREVLVPARASGSARTAMALLLGGRARLRVDGPPLKDRLPPELAGRFALDAAAALKPVSRYDHWKPVAAGLMLLGDYDEAAGLSRAKPVSTISRLAKQMKVPMRSVGNVDIAALVRDGGDLNEAQNIACLAFAMDEMERLAPAPNALGQAWARADLREVNRLYRSRATAPCPLLNPVLDKQVSETTGLVDQALRKKGRSVALVDLSLLLRPGGVLDRLAAQGAAVTSPE